MCIFRFNPPAPGGPCQRCRLCVCVPRWWKLEVEAFGDYADSSAVLRFEPVAGSAHCFWSIAPDVLQGSDPMELRPRAEDDFFEAHNSWDLASYQILDFEEGGAGIQFEFDEWVLWGGGPGLVAYNLRGRDPSGRGYFDCLGPNTFHYWGAFGDPGGEENPNLLGWPASLTISPYYP